MSDVYRYNLKVSELGITNHLIYDVVNFYAQTGIFCDVFCLDSKYENIRGADLDLFIKNRHGKFNYFMIQSKVMNFEGKYLGISGWGPNAQYNKLIKAAHDGKLKAFPLYLLYNGDSINSTQGDSDFGLSIIEATRLSNFRLNQHKNKDNRRLNFNMLYQDMNPYFILFCGFDVPFELPSPIEGNRIFNDYPYQQVVQNWDDILGDDFNEDNGDKPGSNNKQDQEIIQLIRNEGLAKYRIIIEDSTDKDYYQLIKR